MSNRKKIEKIEEKSEENYEELNEEPPETPENELATKRDEAIIVEEELEKEMEERIKKRKEREKLLYEENRIKRWYMENKDNIRIFFIAFFLFLLISIGIIAAVGLYAFLGVTTQELLLIICTGLVIVGVLILILVSQRYLLKE